MSDLDKDIDKDNYRNNVDKSILVVKDIRNSLKPTSVGYISIENVLKELETYKKMVEKLKEKIDKAYFNYDNEFNAWFENEILIQEQFSFDYGTKDARFLNIEKWARKEVEKDD